MSRRHRIVPAVAATLASAAILAPVAQARPVISGAAGGSGKGAVVVERTVHDQPLANPVSVPPSGLNHGAGIVAHTRPIVVASSEGTDWTNIFTGATAGALVIAVCAAGAGIRRRANPAT